MRKSILALLSLLPGALSAITVEVVQVFHPFSLHGTDGVGEMESGEEVLQAAVLPRPVALAGAIPEDLVKAVGDPCRLDSNSPAYDLPEANLLVLCKVRMEVEMLEERLLVQLDLAEMEIPEEVDLTSRQLLTLAIQAIRKTLESYYSRSVERFDWEVRITGTGEGSESLKTLSAKFTIGE